MSHRMASEFGSHDYCWPCKNVLNQSKSSVPPRFIQFEMLTSDVLLMNFIQILLLICLGYLCLTFHQVTIEWYTYNTVYGFGYYL